MYEFTCACMYTAQEKLVRCPENQRRNKKAGYTWGAEK